MISKRLHFTGSLGYKLSALLDLPDHGAPLAYAVFAHCFTCNKNYKILNHVNQALTDNNIGVLRFDFTGLGSSQGSFADTNFSSNVGDILAAAEFLDLNYHSPQLLIGHSFGGAAVIHAAPKIDSCAAVVTIATPVDASSMRAMLLSKKAELEQNGMAVFNISGRDYLIKRQFLVDLEQIDFARAIRRLNKPILICHSPQDQLVNIEEAHRLFQMANHPKSLLSLDRADHLVSNQQDGSYLGTVIAAWARKYLNPHSSLK